MTQLKIVLLGTFQTTQAGQQVDNFETDAARALLSYLVMHRDTPFQREALADLLWPDTPRREALHALSQTLNRLRGAIGDRKATPPYLHITRQTLQFNDESDHVLDVTAFNDALVATRAHPHRRLGACHTCIRRLEQAAALYRGDLIAGFHLESVPFEEWLLLQREMLHRQAMDLFHQLAHIHELRGTYTRAQHYAQRQIALEPWREEAHCQMMYALAFSGQRSAALAQYDTLQDILQQELGVSPSAETTRLYEQICDETLPKPRQPYQNLPLYLTPFIGRQQELDKLTHRFNHPDCHMLTLIGPGGIGKTRLAIQAAMENMHSFQHGIIFVDLSTAHTAEGIATTLAQHLRFKFYKQQDLWTQLRDYVRHKELLIILDNVEHILDHVASILDLLRHAPNLRVLMTSQERLKAPEEWICEVTGMQYCPPNSQQDLEKSEAFQLFTKCAERVVPGFKPSAADKAAIARIATLVQGMPLALELAASWVRALSCEEIAQEIQGDLDFLASTAPNIPSEHRSLRALFNATWTLLSPTEQARMKQLSVFQESFDKAAVQAIVGLDVMTLAKMMDKSLLRSDRAANGIRYTLHKLVQRYARQKLSADSGKEAEICHRHAHYYLTLLQKQEAALKNAQTRHALDSLSADRANIRQAWTWAVKHQQRHLVQPAFKSLFLFYDQSSRLEEGRAQFAETAQYISSETHPLLLAEVMTCQGWFAFQTGQSATGMALLEQSLALLSPDDAHSARAFTLHYLSAAVMHLGKYDHAQKYGEQSLHLYQHLGDPYGEAMALNALGRVAYLMGNYDRAQERTRASLSLAQATSLRQVEADSLRQLGNIAFLRNAYEQAGEHYQLAHTHYCELGNRWGESAALTNLGAVAARLAQHARAQSAMEQCLSIKRDIGDRLGEANTLSNLGILLVEQGMYSKSIAYSEQALKLWRELNARPGEGKTLNNLAYALMCVGQYNEAHDLLEQALAIRRDVQDYGGEVRTLGLLVLLHHYQGANEAALANAQQALDLIEAGKGTPLLAYVLTNQGHALTALEHYGQAEEVYARALTLRRVQGAAYLTMDVLAGLARLALARGQADAALRYVEEILAYLTEHSLNGTNHPFLIYLTCVQVLSTHEDARAKEVLQEAWELLRARAAHIKSPAQRRSFLAETVANQALVNLARDIGVVPKAQSKTPSPSAPRLQSNVPTRGHSGVETV